MAQRMRLLFRRLGPYVSEKRTLNLVRVPFTVMLLFSVRIVYSIGGAPGSCGVSVVLAAGSFSAPLTSCHDTEEAAPSAGDAETSQSLQREAFAALSGPDARKQNSSGSKH